MRLKDSEYELYNWQMSKRSSSFKNALFQAISKSDGENMYLLSLGFPDEVDAYKKFIGKKGYWDKICQAIEG